MNHSQGLSTSEIEPVFLALWPKFFCRVVKSGSYVSIFINVPIRRIANSMNTKSAFTGSFTENPFWYQQFDLRQIRILRGGQPIVDFDTADNCRLYVTTMKAINFQDDIPSIPIDDFKDHYLLVFDLTSMQDATENCHYLELVGEPLRLELNFTNPLENVTELIQLGERRSSVAFEIFFFWTCIMQFRQLSEKILQSTGKFSLKSRNLSRNLFPPTLRDSKKPQLFEFRKVEKLMKFSSWKIDFHVSIRVP